MCQCQKVNKWGDQTTLELIRLIVECGDFLDKDKRGDFNVCEDLQCLVAMQHPGGGKNDIPNRLKKNFLFSTWCYRVSQVLIISTVTC